MAKPKALAKSVLQKALNSLVHFSASTDGSKLVATFTFNTHVDALAFIARITVHAEVNQHHPDLLYTYKKVKVTLTTHDAKTITQKDLDMAKKIESLNAKDGG